MNVCAAGADVVTAAADLLRAPVVRSRVLMLYMVIERFKNRDARAVYARAREQGRMLPEGLGYVVSWVETNFDRCFQVMECDDERLLREWADR